MSLSDLPPELIHHIAWSLNADTDTAHLAQTCWRIHAETIPILYRQNHLFHDNSALVWAVLENVPAALYRARQAGITISDAVPDLLHMAVTAQHSSTSTSIINTLIREFGFSPSGHDANGYTPLIHAAKQGSLAAARTLIANGANASQPAANSARETPLHAAMAADNSPVASLLLNAGCRVSPQLADFISVDTDLDLPPGTSPLHIATRNNNISLVRLLLDHGADATMPKLAAGMSPLQIALRDHHAGIARLLLERGADLSLACGFDPGYAVYFAALHADFEMVKVLVEFGAPVNIPMGQQQKQQQQQEAMDLSCLKMALVNRHVDMALFLVESGAHMVSNGQDLVDLASRYEMDGVVEAMRRKKGVSGRAFLAKKRSLTGLGRRLRHGFAQWKVMNMAVKACS